MTQLIHVSETGLSIVQFALISIGVAFCICLVSSVSVRADQKSWRIGAPIVKYWAGPPMTDAVAKQMAEGNWNLVWCREGELEIAHKYGLRALLHDPLLNPTNLDQPDQKAKLDALIQRVRSHPALYAYYLRDEPSVPIFPELGRLAAYLRERDPSHTWYINLYPIYANNQQLGTTGEPIPAYQEHLDRFVEILKPDLISYDHYHFSVKGDGNQYFLNLAMIRQTAMDAGVPFLNIVQACSWTPSMRIPTGHELRWLVYTSLAYGWTDCDENGSRPRAVGHIRYNNRKMVGCGRQSYGTVHPAWRRSACASCQAECLNLNPQETIYPIGQHRKWNIFWHRVDRISSLSLSQPDAFHLHVSSEGKRFH